VSTIVDPSTNGHAGNGAAGGEPLVRLRDVTMLFPVRAGVLQRVKGHVRAVDGVSVDIMPGETLGLVGESGSGKSTLGRVAIRLLEPTKGTVHFDGRDITKLKPSAVRPMRRDMQMVFQDPYSSLDPLTQVGQSVAEPLETHDSMSRAERETRVAELLSMVGLPAEHLHRYPRELSGGQLQRLSIARALTVNPRLIVLDEPVSALDVSTQAQVINLLEELQQNLKLTYLLIAHNPSLVRHASDHIAVMYLGRVVEQGGSDDVYLRPKHPYTRSLLSAIPVADPLVQRERRRIVLEGDIPSPTNPPSGCRFHTRCPWVMDVCHTVDPEGYVTPDGSVVHCHLHTTGPTLAGETVLSLPMPKGASSPT